MSQRIPLAWLQLKHEKMKLFAAVAGVMVSVVLMWMQLGLMKALFASAVVFHGSMNGDLVIAHSQYEHLLHSKVFSSRLLYRLRGSPDVSDVYSIYLAAGEWKNPWNGEMRAIQCYGIETDEAALSNIWSNSGKPTCSCMIAWPDRDLAMWLGLSNDRSPWNWRLIGVGCRWLGSSILGRRLVLTAMFLSVMPTSCGSFRNANPEKSTLAS
jgi:hypothetical protein